MGTGLEAFKSYAVHLAEWSMDVTIIRTEGGAFYFPIRHVCKGLGISHATQIDTLRADDRYAEALREFRLVTAGGPQDAVCIRKREAAWWLANINTRRVGAHVRDRLEEFQADLMAAADRLAFGDLSDVLSGGNLPARQARGAITFGCLRCGAPHRATIEAGAFILEIDE